MQSSSTTWNFSRCFANRRNSVFFVSNLRSLEADGIHMSQIFTWSGEWSSYSIPWPVVSLCLVPQPQPTLLCIGLNGQVHSASKDGFSEQAIDDSSEGPPYRGDLRDVRLIGSHVYAVGMGRQAYKRSTDGSWERIDKGLLVAPGDANIIGLTSIDGSDEEEIYAVGWGGEIWLREHGAWRECASPTNVKLERVLVSPSRTAFACGQAGVVLVGEKDEWSLVEHDVTDDQFWSISWFLDQLWLSTKSSIYRLNNDRSLESVDLGFGDERISCGWLDSADGTMWSVGDNHILSTTDGEEWTLHRIPDSDSGA